MTTLNKLHIQRYDKLGNGIGCLISSSIKQGNYYKPFVVKFPNAFIVSLYRSTLYDDRYIITWIHHKCKERIRNIVSRLNGTNAHGKEITINNMTNIQLKVNDPSHCANSDSIGYLVGSNGYSTISMNLTYIYYDPLKNSCTVSLKYDKSRIIKKDITNLETMDDSILLTIRLNSMLYGNDEEYDLCKLEYLEGLIDLSDIEKEADEIIYG